MTEFTHVDCFAGPGGICTGLHAAGFKTLVAIEFIESCCETYKKNHPDVHVIHKDICDVSAEEILPYIPKKGVDLVTSGMPCETFSTAGNTSRSFYDERQFLYRQGIRIAEICNAKFLLFENVPGITSKRVARNSKRLIIDQIESELDDHGFINHKRFILSAAEFGVPQNRKRFFILATKDPRIELIAPVPNPNGRKVTVKEAFAGLPDVVPNSNCEGTIYTDDSSDYAKLMKNDVFWKRADLHSSRLTYHMPMKHRSYTLERFKLLNPGESLKNLFDRFTGKERERLQAMRILPKKIFIKRNYRLILDEPSPTVTSHCLDEFVHPTANRALTVRECARLQSFPDSYDFAGGPYITPHLHNNIQDKYEQIGDAVPPLLAFAWGKTIHKLLRKKAIKKIIIKRRVLSHESGRRFRIKKGLVRKSSSSNRNLNQRRYF
jgi:DNA (cytosine-5)-methyltransferase 1